MPRSSFEGEEINTFHRISSVGICLYIMHVPNRPHLRTQWTVPIAPRASTNQASDATNDRECTE